MITVITAGGSGTRLWPLSTPAYPKHLICINNHKRSLLQHTHSRVSKLGGRVFVIPEISHAHHAKEQLPELNPDDFIVEPGRRGTAGCLVATLVHLEKHCDPDEPIALVAADHYVRDIKGFVHSFQVAGEVSKKTGQIVLVGIEPDYPATGFGYIQKGEILDEARLVFRVRSFKEKPTYRAAKELVKSGEYLWNCSYYIASIHTFKNNLKKHAPQLYANYKALKAAKTPEAYTRTYLSFETDTIDYALSEHAGNDYLIVSAAFDWMDLGSYGDLHKAVESDESGNHLAGKKIELAGVENAFIQNTEDKPLAVVGLDNIVVVNTKDGILVARKDLAKQIGEVSKRINK